ncbi:MAG TPA: PKD domain-containing protein, partial [Nitrososphaeraceae archaeon]|nr:PKD domain-containing protein [Nitrososphaeraceae archaeon]
MTVLLSLSIVLGGVNNNTTISMVAYGDNNNNNDHKMKNSSTIKDVSDQIVSSDASVGVGKEQVQQLLQLLQTQIAQTSGQDKATNAIKQIKSVVKANPNGPLAQSLLYLAEQQAAGNFNSINAVSFQVAANLASGQEDIGQIIQEAASHAQQVLSSQAPSSSSSSSPPLQPPAQQTMSLSASSQPQSLPTSTSLPSAPQQPTGSGQVSIIPQKDSGNTLRSEDHSQHVRIAPGSSGITAINNGANSQIQTPVEPTLFSPTSPPQLRSQVTTNSPPIADAGHSRPDQTVNEGSLVTLDGSASHDPDGDTLTYAWTQTSGPPVQLSNPNSAKSTFTAPSNLQQDITLNFELTVTDSGGLSSFDIVSILVKHNSTPPPPPPPNPPPAADNPPIADAGHSADKIVNEGSLVTLDGSASHDPDGDTLTYAWTQTSGPPVQLSSPTGSTTTFTAPSNLQQDTTLNFKLTVTDSHGMSSSDTASILVKHTGTTPPPPPPPPSNSAPIAVVGPDQTVNGSTTVTLDGSASHDPDGDPITFMWNQTSGPTVVLSNPAGPKPTFTAPSNLQDDTALFFKLTVTDNAGLSDSMVQKITVMHSTLLPPPPPPSQNGTEMIYTPLPGGRIKTKENTSGGNCVSDGIRFNIANDRTLVDRETTWVFTLNNNPASCTDKPWWSPKIGSHGSTGEGSGLYEASVPYSGGFKAMRSEGPHPQYHSCSGYQHGDVPPMPQGKPIGIKTAQWRIPNGVHVEFWYD